MDAFHVPVDYPVRPAPWHRELMRAVDASDVLSTVKDYLVVLTPEELAGLPGRCSVERFQDPDDVKVYAAWLAQMGRVSSLWQDAQRALAFFLVAANRLSEIERRLS